MPWTCEGPTEEAKNVLTRHGLGASYYTSSVAVRPEHYGELIDRGWRRYDSVIRVQFSYSFQ